MINKTLSIITINLNNREGLSKTLHSVFHQTFIDYEYIVIDGASTDGSVELIKENANKFSYWISEPDLGVYQAMNKGINKAMGNYLLFLNSGDYLVSDTLLEQIFKTKHSADILACGCNMVLNKKNVHTSVPPANITFGYLYLTGINHQSTFIRRELFYTSGFYHEDFKYNADIEFWFRTIILENASVESIPVILTDYNLEGISAKHNNKPEFKEELRKIFSHPLLVKFIPDYENWKAQQVEMKILYWAKSKKIVFWFLKVLFGLARVMKMNKHS